MVKQYLDMLIPWCSRSYIMTDLVYIQHLLGIPTINIYASNIYLNEVHTVYCTKSN